MTSILIFVAFVALILVGGYLKAKKEANSTPLKRSFNRAASLWNQADPKHRAMMLASVGVLENSPSFAVYLTSTWGQLDLKLCALLAATIDAVRESPTFTSEKSARLMERNPALEELESQPRTAITAGLIAAVPALATELYGDAGKGASALGISDPAFIDCVFDLQLVGAFEKAMNFTGDMNLASLFVDAMVFKATGKSPSVPSESDLNVGSTRQHRGLPKYVLARKHFSVRDPVALLFGREYATAKGKGLNPDDVDRGIIAALYARQAGAWAAEIALTGKSPTNEEISAFSKSIDAIGIDAQAERPQATQMFDPPITGSVMIAGCPVWRIPNSEKKYPNFLAWWASVGRLNPRAAQGWSTLSGPGVMFDRVEMINPAEWAALPEEERELVRAWVETWPCGVFFD